MCAIIGVLTSGIHHQHQPAVISGRIGARDHQIVEDAAIAAQKLRVALASQPQPGDFAWRQRFEHSGCGGVARPGEIGLPHMRHIEQAGGLARMQMFLDEAFGVSHRHVVAGEGHHLGAKLQMQRVQRRALQIGFGDRLFRAGHISPATQSGFDPERSGHQAPSVT